jgi:hypothetical protein
MIVDVNDIWDIFLENLAAQPNISKVIRKKVTGIPFLYIDTSLGQNEVELIIRERSAKAMKGKRLQSMTTFVRMDNMTYVYRHRFYVPQQKMFCCGNLCDDCVRLQPATEKFWR